MVSQSYEERRHTASGYCCGSRYPLPDPAPGPGPGPGPPLFMLPLPLLLLLTDGGGSDRTYEGERYWRERGMRERYVRECRGGES